MFQYNEEDGFYSLWLPNAREIWSQVGHLHWAFLSCTRRMPRRYIQETQPLPSLTAIANTWRTNKCKVLSFKMPPTLAAIMTGFPGCLLFRQANAGIPSYRWKTDRQGTSPLRRDGQSDVRRRKVAGSSSIDLSNIYINSSSIFSLGSKTKIGGYTYNFVGYL